jgi:adenosylcobinamide-GDP ribazoletransferase
MTDPLRPAAAALSFLTCAPLGRLVHVEPTDIARGAWLFPLVGGVVGGASGLLADVLAGRVPSLVVGMVAVGVAALLTGAMHLDGLADTADSLGAASREHALAIMRDHAVGTFGAVALIVVCTLDAAALGALAETEDAAVVGLAAGAAGRAAMLPPAWLLPYARTGEGQGRVLAGMSGATVLVALVLALVLALPAGSIGLSAVAAAAVVAAVLALFASWRFGGVTGDVLGATAKLCETTALVVGAALVS